MKNGEKLMIRNWQFMHLVLGLCLLLPGAAKSDIVSIAVIPDTQYYAEQNPEILEAQIDWIVAKQADENIVYVAHLGDLKDDSACDNRLIFAGTGNGRSEWQIVNDAFLKLENANIAYGVVPGNHDFDSINNDGPFGCPNWDTVRPLNLFNNPNFGFPPTRFTNRNQPYYGDPGVQRGNRVDGSNEDNFTLFDASGLKFIAINLAYRPDANADDQNPNNDDGPELTWAERLLDRYPDRLAIVTSHHLVEQNPEVEGIPATCPRANECQRDCPRKTDFNAFGAYGQEVYDRLASYPNFFMMLSGHWYGEAWRVEDRSAEGMRPVHALMQDYQAPLFPQADGDPTTPGNNPNPAGIDFGNLQGSKCNIGDSGFMRIMRFDTDTGMVNIETFIPPVMPIQNRPGTLVSTYFATDGTDMDKDTASNLSLSFAGYVGVECNHLWVLDNVDPDFSNPPFEDVLSVFTDLDPALTPRLAGSIANLNTSQTIGGQRTIAVLPDGQSALVADWTGDTLARYRLDQGNIVVDWSVPVPEIISVALSRNGDAYVLSGTTIFGDQVLRIDVADGQVLDSGSFGGFEIAVDDANDAVWVVGATIRRLDRELNQVNEIDPVEFSAVSVAPDTDGTAWVAERLNSSIPGSLDRLLRISSDGSTVLQTISLPGTPFSVAVDPNDNSVWVGLLNSSVQKYDASGTQLLDLPNDAYTIQLDPGDGSVWVGRRDGDLVRYASDGTQIDFITRGLGAADTRIALANFCGI